MAAHRSHMLLLATLQAEHDAAACLQAMLHILALHPEILRQRNMPQVCNQL